MSDFTPEEIEATAAFHQSRGGHDTAAMLRDYATLRQAPAQGGVTEAIKLLRDFQSNIGPRRPDDDEDECEAWDRIERAIAALSAQQGQVEAVAVIGSGWTLCWIGTGPIAPIIEKHSLKVGDKLYTAPPAQPAERVPEGFMEKVRPAVKAAHTKAYRAVMDAQHSTYPSHYLTVLKQDEKFWGDLLDEIDAVLANRSTPSPAHGDGEHEPDCNLNMASVERQLMGCDCRKRGDGGEG